MNFRISAVLLTLSLGAIIPVVSSQCASAILPLVSNSSQCDSSNMSLASGCQMLYTQLEAALLEPTNLYTLRQSFFPSSKAQPNVIPVEYTITLKFDNFSEPCTGEENQMEAQNETYMPICVQVIWTSSAVFSEIHSRELDYLQPTLLYLFNIITTDRPYGALDYIHLHLNIENLPCIPSQEQLLYGLSDISTMVSATVPNIVRFHFFR